MNPSQALPRQSVRPLTRSLGNVSSMPSLRPALRTRQLHLALSKHAQQRRIDIDGPLCTWPRLQHQQPRRGLVSAPQPGSGPIMSRRPDRELPDVAAATRRWIVTMPIFAALVGVSALAIFNYEKANSSVVGATMYSLRTHPGARAVLGDNVYFRDRFPWVWGELNQVHGRIDIGYGVKGTRGNGYMRFKAVRKSRMALFETLDWSLELEDGTVIRLLEDEKGHDPFGKEAQEAEKKS